MSVLGCPLQEIVFDRVSMMAKTYINFELDCSIIIVSKLKIIKKVRKLTSRLTKLTRPLHK